MEMKTEANAEVLKTAVVQRPLESGFTSESVSTVFCFKMPNSV